MALVGLPVLASKQIVINGNLIGIQTKAENFVGHHEIALRRIAFGPALIHQASPPGLSLHPYPELVLGHYDTAADMQSGEVLFRHQLVGAGDGDAQRLCHQLCAEKQR